VFALTAAALAFLLLVYFRTWTGSGCDLLGLLSSVWASASPAARLQPRPLVLVIPVFLTAAHSATPSSPWTGTTKSTIAAATSSRRSSCRTRRCSRRPSRPLSPTASGSSSSRSHRFRSFKSGHLRQLLGGLHLRQRRDAASHHSLVHRPARRASRRRTRRTLPAAVGAVVLGTAGSARWHCTSPGCSAAPRRLSWRCPRRRGLVVLLRADLPDRDVLGHPASEGGRRWIVIVLTIGLFVAGWSYGRHLTVGT